MTSRERFLATFRDGVVGCAPRFDRGVRDEVLATWRQQGMPEGVGLSELFGLDRWQTGGLGGSPGIVLRARPDLDGPVKSPEEAVAWRSHFGFEDRYSADWDEQVAATRGRTWPLGFHSWRGLFLSCGVGNGATLVDHLYFLIDYPETAESMMAYLADWTIQLLRPVLADLKTDYLLVGEPIAGNDAPVIGPTMFRRFLAPAYRALIDLAREAGIEVFIWESYGQIEPLLPVVVECGFNVVWIGEAGAAGTDYVALRRKLGPEIGLLGGIDGTALLRSPEAVETEVRRVCEPLLAEGRYAPLLDSRPRENVPYKNYVAYQRAVSEVLGSVV